MCIFFVFLHFRDLFKVIQIIFNSKVFLTVEISYVFFVTSYLFNIILLAFDFFYETNFKRVINSKIIS